MRKICNKGHRIRASDKQLVYHFSIGTLLFVFVAVLLLLNTKQLMRTDWEHFSLLENGLTLSPYNFITILIATGVCALVAFLYYRFCYDSFKKLLHRQKLARMILENKWYEADTVQDSGFFTDLQSRSREKIVWFPKIYYQMEKGLLHIRCEITLGKYQDQLLRLEDKLESGLYCELTDKTLHDGYIEYTLLYDMIANRITIDEVRAEKGCLRLMKNLVWEYDALPHALIAGGTGGGKTYFLLTLIEALLHTNAVLYILDPKNSDLALFVIVSLAISCVLGLAVKNQAKLTMYSQVVFLPSIMLSGIMFSAELLPNFLESIGKLFPATWGYTLLIQKNIDISTFLPLLLILAISVFASMQLLKKIRSE